MSTLTAYHGKEALKAKYVSRVEAHAKHDEIIQGKYWENGKGCAVGCTVEQNMDAHEAMEEQLGIPRALAFLEDRIFERLTNGEAKQFPLRFLKAIRPGADLSMVTSHFVLWLLTDEKDGVAQYAFDDGKAAIQQVAGLYRRRIAGDEPCDKDWSAAESAARSAASAARSARSAESAAESAWSAANTKMADKLIELLSEAV